MQARSGEVGVRFSDMPRKALVASFVPAPQSVSKTTGSGPEPVGPAANLITCFREHLDKRVPKRAVFD